MRQSNEDIITNIIGRIMSASTSIPSASHSPAEEKRVAPSSLLTWSDSEESRMLPVFTLVLWLVCFVVGMLGLVIAYARPRLAAPAPEPFVAQQVPVELAPELSPPPEPEPLPPDPAAPPPAPDIFTPPSIVQPIAVAQPGPAIAFPVPVEGPARIVDLRQAESGRRPLSRTNNSSAATAPVPLTLGESEGKQPAPEYPRAAIRLGQEGTVVVRLSVDESGRVTAAEAATPSPWPLLNEAALRAVRARWHFGSGGARVYEVPIRFQLEK